MDFELLAAQLRKPEGEQGKTVAENMNSTNRAINLHTIQLLQLKAYDNVLEVGMGNGFFCKDVLARHDSITYTGCDFSDLMITEALALNQGYVADKRAHFVGGDINHLPFEDNSFSKCFTVNTIYFWEQPEQALAEVYRVLEPGGVAIISLRTKESMLQLPFVAYGFRLWEEDELLPVLGDAGFASIRMVHEPDPVFHMGEQEIQLHSLYVICRK
ncbi:class I SAM-dependent methyltransferase [Filimonas effusa]|uniref:Class I SAM-dependent methyltransferase n=1 Tax=Filimonas effusa TaxID=2508721 RepID=A0A4V1M9K2_9BACT|nr:class I SAM-dependent methyltransferase [Filimonas effusa]RXK81438.1 class I SAM-dependent methyltransferase [Filimonas effusa]